MSFWIGAGFVVSALGPSLGYSADSPTNYISVGQAQTKKSVVGFPAIQMNSEIPSQYGKTLSETIEKDLIFMGTFSLLDRAAFHSEQKQSGIEPGTFQLSEWSSQGAEFLILSRLKKENAETLSFETHVYEVATAKELLSRTYWTTPKQMKEAAHTFANDFVQSVTHLPGIFLTKIAMSCDRSGKKEIYVMNFDGSEVRQVTHHQSVSFGPAWNPEGNKLAYSVITRHSGNIKNIDLFEFDLTENSIRILSSKKGINSGPAYTPDGKSLALTLSYTGNAEIYLLNLESKALTPLTHSGGLDVDPAWSSDGKHLAFVSSRSGRPMIFSAKSDGSQVQRLTLAGKYNATPSWSPQNQKIAFAGWIDKKFDIFMMNSDGTHMERLTKDQGNNEDPFFSPDGNFIVFSSNRTGQKNIYVMNFEGTFVKRLTYGLGNCVSPKWSNPPALRTIKTN
ncbi:MAG: hypothetical protein ACO3A2_02300 [Bdellovibrionia bacterium]